MNLFYNAAVDNDWNTLGNWWQDDQFTVPADSLPTSADDVQLFVSNYGDAIFNSGSDAVANSVNGMGTNPVLSIMTLTCAVLAQVNIDVSSVVNIVDGTESVFAPRTVAEGWSNGTINGSCTAYLFNNIGGAINGDCNFLYSNNFGGTVNGNATFDETSANFYVYVYGTVTGDATFALDGEWFQDGGSISNLFGTVYGVCTFTGSNVSFKLNGSDSWTYDTTNWVFPNCVPFWSFYDSSSNNGTINGACNFYDGAGNGNLYYGFSGTITGTCNFHDYSYNIGIVTGDCNFYDGAGNGNLYYGSSATITGACTLHDSSYNANVINGDCTFNDNSSNRSYVYGNATFNDTSFMNYNSTNTPLCFVYGNATFNDGAWNHADGFVSLSATFNGNSVNAGTIGDGSTPAIATFNDNAINGYIWWIDRTQQDAAQYAGRIRGDAVFRGNSRNEVNVTGTVTTDYAHGINGSSILGIL